jgi:hypothetical protein
MIKRGETMTFEEFLNIEKKLTVAGRGKGKLEQRFFELGDIGIDIRDRIQRVEHEVLERALRARWKMQEADAKAKNLVGKIEAENRRVDAHAKILLGVAAIRLARVNVALREDLLTLALEMPSANKEYIETLFDVRNLNDIDVR